MVDKSQVDPGIFYSSYVLTTNFPEKYTVQLKTAQCISNFLWLSPEEVW